MGILVVVYSIMQHRGKAGISGSYKDLSYIVVYGFYSSNG